ncbi:hypothetical protein NDU88_004709 [Pleurodeles waltl]|uniref:Uncharacterized protein n=1 Tax=Pleurodeles waltl TaxID=8319 RepID=A0AAV7TTB8_PLEWA|nr:hypothetical protein NDU88_004709 [Pleurodeles waltl]
MTPMFPSPCTRLTVRTSNLVQNPTSGEDNASSLLERARLLWPSSQPPGRLHSLVKHPGGVQGAGPDPLMERICPWPIVVLPQGLLRGEVRLLARSQPRLAAVPRNSPRPAEGGGESPDVRYPGEEGGGAAQGGTETEYGLNALARLVAPCSSPPTLFQIPGQDGGCSFLLRSTPRQHLRPAARTHLEPPASGERLQKRIPPQGCGSGAPGAPRKFFRGEPERST